MYKPFNSKQPILVKGWHWQIQRTTWQNETVDKGMRVMVKMTSNLHSSLFLFYIDIAINLMYLGFQTTMAPTPLKPTQTSILLEDPVILLHVLCVVWKWLERIWLDMVAVRVLVLMLVLMHAFVSESKNVKLPNRSLTLNPMRWHISPVKGNHLSIRQIGGKTCYFSYG